MSKFKKDDKVRILRDPEDPDRPFAGEEAVVREVAPGDSPGIYTILVKGGDLFIEEKELELVDGPVWELARNKKIPIAKMRDGLLLAVIRTIEEAHRAALIEGWGRLDGAEQIPKTQAGEDWFNSKQRYLLAAEEAGPAHHEPLYDALVGEAVKRGLRGSR